MQNCSEGVFVISRIKMQFLGLVISDQNDENIAESFYEKELQKTS